MSHWSRMHRFFVSLTAFGLLLVLLGLLCAFAIFPAVVDTLVEDHLGDRQNSYTVVRKYSVFASSQQLDMSNGEKPVLVAYGPYAFTTVRTMLSIRSASFFRL